MPLYEYSCKNCGHYLEKMQKFQEPALTICPACNEATLVKLISAPAFRLKGQGWYETDFKKGDQKNIAGDKETSSSEKSNLATESGSPSSKKEDGSTIGDGSKKSGTQNVSSDKTNTAGTASPSKDANTSRNASTSNTSTPTSSSHHSTKTDT